MFDAAQMLVIKEGAGHKQYELERKVNDELIHAAMKGDVEKLRMSLESSANPNASRDMYNLESLHYAANHGDIAMVKPLLESRASVTSLDEQGCLPVFRAVLLQRTQECHDIVPWCQNANIILKQCRDEGMLGDPSEGNGWLATLKGYFATLSVRNLTCRHFSMTAILS